MKKNLAKALLLIMTFQSSFASDEWLNRCWDSYENASRRYISEQEQIAKTYNRSGLISLGVGLAGLIAVGVANNANNEKIKDISIGVSSAGLISGTGLILAGFFTNESTVNQANNHYKKVKQLMIYLFAPDHSFQFIFDELYQNIHRLNPKATYQDAEVIIREGFEKELFCSYYPITLDGIAEYAAKKSR